MENFLQELAYAVVLAATPILTTFICKWLSSKSKAIQQNTQSNSFDTTIMAVEALIANAVRATTQTYVDALKKEHMFDKEAQLEAFNKTKDAIMAQLTEDSKKVILAVYGDIDAYLTTQIEAQVKFQK